MQILQLYFSNYLKVLYIQIYIYKYIYEYIHKCIYAQKCTNICIKYTHDIFFRYSEMQILNEQLISYDQCIYLRNQ